MPFGLLNAPTTFNRLMNDTFREFLNQFSLAFFDDILVYPRDQKERDHHLHYAFDKLKEHKPYTKKSRSIFYVKQVKYLGYVISSEGVKLDPSKSSNYKTVPNSKES